MGACHSFLCNPAKKPAKKTNLGLGKTWYFDRKHLACNDLMTGRVYKGGNLDKGTETKAHACHLDFFKTPAPGTRRGLAWVPVWRLAEGLQPLDEIDLVVDSKGEHLIAFNGKPNHGTWIFEDGFLDICVNVRFGEPGNKDPPDQGKWVRFQNVPGTATWVRCEAYDDHTWVVLLIQILDDVHMEATASIAVPVGG